jgi:predicted component of type VI protein secretion system
LGEFERAVSLPDELQLYFQEKQQPALADALRALVGRGSDQLLRVSQLSPDDMQAASAAACASITEQVASLHEELQRSFSAQFEIQAQMEADAGKFDVVKIKMQSQRHELIRACLYLIGVLARLSTAFQQAGAARLETFS